VNPTSQTYGPVRVTTFRSGHPEIGREVTRHVRVGPLNVSFMFARGMYGLPHTPSYGVRVWWVR
jgi:hypothetical protein